MTGPVILAIDQGTTNSKALLVAPDGSVLATRVRPMQVDYPRPGWAEQSATAIWEAVAGLIAEIVAAAPEAEIAALALSNQRETVVLWDAATGEPIAPAVIWQCQRSVDRCRALRDAGLEEEIAARSGLGVDPLFPAAKIGWLLDAIPGARARAERGELRCGTVDSWLLWNLSGGALHATDPSNASRTQLFNLESRTWDERLAEIFAVPPGLLPRILPSDGGFGTVAAGRTALPVGTPIRVMLGDSHAALFAHGIAAPGQVKATIGTGSSLMAATATRVRSTHGLSATIAWQCAETAPQYAIEGNISVSGHAAAFTTALLNLADEAELTRLAASVPDSGGAVFVPALAGLGAPHWQPGARGLIAGMTLGTRPEHVARATLEAIALQIDDVLDAMEADLGLRLAQLSIDGGASRSDFLAQLLADLTGRAVVRPEIAEASALGVARMAAEALGFGDWRTLDAARFDPELAPERRDAIRRRWRTALAAAVAAGEP